MKSEWERVKYILKSYMGMVRDIFDVCEDIVIVLFHADVLKAFVP